MSAHDFDYETRWCTQCGCGQAWAHDRQKLSCDGGGNVVGISHIVRGKRLRLLVNGVQEMQK